MPLWLILPLASSALKKADRLAHICSYRTLVAVGIAPNLVADAQCVQIGRAFDPVLCAAIGVQPCQPSVEHFPVCCPKYTSLP